MCGWGLARKSIFAVLIFGSFYQEKEQSPRGN